MRRFWLYGTMMVGLNAAGVAMAAPATDAVESGRRVAVNLCSTCHDVSANQEFPPALINPAPSFAAIANRPGTTRTGVRTFLNTTHGDISSFPAKMPDLMLTDAQKDSATAYILSLRGKR